MNLESDPIDEESIKDISHTNQLQMFQIEIYKNQPINIDFKVKENRPNIMK